MTERKVVDITNPSDLLVSRNKEFLYSITDDGVRAFRILPDGDLETMNENWIGGMRGCYLDVDDKNRYVFVGGYHDGRVSMLHLNEDGSIGEIASGVFHKGVGRSAADRSSRPHVNCVKVTPDQKYLCAVDGGLDHVKVYKIDYDNGKLKLTDIIHSDLDSAPKMIRFSKDGKNAYILNELENSVDVYRYYVDERGAEFERIQKVSTQKVKRDHCSSQNMEFSLDGKYLYCTIAGSTEMAIFERDEETGLLTMNSVIPISGDFPKALAVFPGNKYFVSLNHESNEICTFRMDYEKKYALMDGKPIKIDKPNCIYIHKLKGE